MSELDYVVSGSFTDVGTAEEIDLSFQPDWVELRARGNTAGATWTSTATPGVVKEAFWYSGMAQDTALATVNTDGAATDEKSFIASNGIMQRKEDPTALGNAVSGSAITNANPAVVTANSHGFQTGDVVVLTNTTDMRQIAGLPFTITRVDANNFSLDGLDASGFAAAATNVEARRVLFPNLFKPALRYITDITASGSQTQLTFSVSLLLDSGDPAFAVDQELRLTVPEDYGANEINGERLRVTSVPSPTTVVVDFNPSVLSTFSFPTSAEAAQGVTFAHAASVGTRENDIDAAVFRNTTTRGFTIGSNVLSGSEGLVFWKAGLSAKVV